jgi:hypothetical protein
MRVHPKNHKKRKKWEPKMDLLIYKSKTDENGKKKTAISKHDTVRIEKEFALTM